MTNEPSRESNTRSLPMAIGSLNKLVIDHPITIAIEAFYDLSLPESWDDKCVLLTSEDKGATYKQEVLLTDGAFVESSEKNVKVIFEKVLSNLNYSCFIDQGDGTSVVLFQNLLVTEDMAIAREEQ